MGKKIFIDTLGCAKNDYDSQMLAASLIERGCVVTQDAAEADILIVNTCGFIEDAKRESIERIFEYSDAKDKDVRLVVTGCLSERYHSELAAEMPEVDMFFGVNDYDDLPGILLDEYGDSSSSGSALSSDRVGRQLDDLRYRKREFDKGAYTGVLKIAEGCNNACSFCAIPSIRGPYRSKRIEDCVREAEDMAAAGIRELILIAQDTSQYGRDLYGEIRLPELLHRLCRIEGIEWIRLMYVYDNGITDELIRTIREEPKICKYIDMPIQHVSDHVLNMMRRQSSGASIRTAIRRLRDEIPDIHIRTTLLVGFPGETEDDVQQLVDFIDEMKIDRMGAFAFSDEEGTASYEMDGKLDEETKEARRDLIMQHQMAVSTELNERKIGRTYEIIVDEICGDGLYAGRSRYDSPEIDCAVTFSSDEELQPGDIVNVLIKEAFEYDLEGVRV